VYSIFWFLACLAIIFLLAATPVFRFADTPPTFVKDRNITIDGLRGILALGVFFHHVAIYPMYQMTGVWRAPPDRFYANIGPTGVSVFFMITGYLFWMQMLSAKGRPNLAKLYISRFFRIVPLYTVLAVTILIVAGIATGWTRHVEPFKLLVEIARWLSGGLLIGGAVNGFVLAAASVTWTLQYEWYFYFSLSITRFFARRAILATCFAGLILLLSLAIISVTSKEVPFSFVAMFSVGMLVATGQFLRLPDPLRLPDWARSTVALSAIVCALLLFEAYAAIPVILLGIFFVYVAGGTTLFGLLLTRPARRLGDISYGIYLLQGPVLFLAYAIPASKELSAASPLGHWSVAALAGCVLVAIATAAHVYIERPAIEFGRRVSQRFSRPELRAKLARTAA
jgi:peptidoglycan/LPS O-acetylase OafA/YrhL